MNLKDVSDLLVAEEGEILSAYQDHLGYWTIGVGRLIDKAKGGGITKVESRYLLANDIARFELKALGYPWYADLDEVRQGVIVCMLFQLGSLDKWQNFRAALTAKDWASAKISMLNSKWARQTPARAKRMAKIMETGVWR